MSIASQLRNDLKRMLAAYGRELTIRRNEGLPYDMTQGIRPASTDDTEFSGVGRVGTYSDRIIDGEQILRGDRRVTFIPYERDYTNPDYVARIDDIVVVDDTTDGQYKVIQAQQREIGGELICWTLQVRNG